MKQLFDVNSSGAVVETALHTARVGRHWENSKSGLPQLWSPWLHHITTHHRPEGFLNFINTGDYDPGEFPKHVGTQTKNSFQRYPYEWSQSSLYKLLVDAVNHILTAGQRKFNISANIFAPTIGQQLTDINRQTFAQTATSCSAANI